MVNIVNKPVRMFCKYGYVNGEQWKKGGPDIYNFGRTIKERCDKFYSEDEIKQMEDEVKNAPQAVCGICFSPIITADNCAMCGEYHKFHRDCLESWWNTNPAMESRCPFSPHEDNTWEIPCPVNKKNVVTDWYGGGKNRLKKSKKTRKAKKGRKVNKKTKRRTRRKESFKHYSKK